MMDSQACIFCAIVAGSSPADIVYKGKDTVFFRDISPQAVVHIVGVPKKHIPSLSAASQDDRELLGTLMYDAAEAARRVGVHESGYRIITNTGSDGGQEVQHLHVHLLGGEKIGRIRCRL